MDNRQRIAVSFTDSEVDLIDFECRTEHSYSKQEWLNGEHQPTLTQRTTNFKLENW